MLVSRLLQLLKFLKNSTDAMISDE